MKRFILFALTLTSLFLLAACQSQPDIVTQEDLEGDHSHGVMAMNAWARPSLTQNGNGAIYVTLVNEAHDDDILLSAESDVAEAVEIHESMMDGDVMKMTPVEYVIVPAEGRATLEPGGLHIMLINLKQALEPGDTIPVTLNFENGGAMEIIADVKEGGGGMEMDHSQMEQDK